MLEKIIKLFENAKPSEIKVKWGGMEKFYNNEYSINEGEFNFQLGRSLCGDTYRFEDYTIEVYKDKKIIKSFSSFFGSEKKTEQKLLINAYKSVEKKVGTYLKRKEENREKVNDEKRAKGLKELKNFMHTK